MQLRLQVNSRGSDQVKQDETGPACGGRHLQPADPRCRGCLGLECTPGTYLMPAPRHAATARCAAPPRWSAPVDYSAATKKCVCLIDSDDSLRCRTGDEGDMRLHPPFAYTVILRTNCLTSLMHLPDGVESEETPCNRYEPHAPDSRRPEVHLGRCRSPLLAQPLPISLRARVSLPCLRRFALCTALLLQTLLLDALRLLLCVALRQAAGRCRSLGGCCDWQNATGPRRQR